MPASAWHAGLRAHPENSQVTFPPFRDAQNHFRYVTVGDDEFRFAPEFRSFRRQLPQPIFGSVGDVRSRNQLGRV